MNPSDITSDIRALKLFSLNLGIYSVSGAICSYGDVIDFVDGLKQGVVLADTCGHDEEAGKNMAAFLRKEIENGWGVKGDAAVNLEELGRKLSSLRDQSIPYWKSYEWFDMVSALYAQFDGENISLSMGGGLGKTLILRNDGNLERFCMKGGTIDLTYLEEHDAPYFTALAKNEIMLLQTDGLIDNIRKRFYFSLPEHKGNEMDYRTKVIDYTDGLVAGIITEKAHESAEIIRDTLVEKLSSYFLPQSARDDDVTFAVIKKI